MRPWLARRPLAAALGLVLSVGLLSGGCASTGSPDRGHGADPYAQIVWPPPPDEPRIKLEEVVLGRVDVETKSSFRRRLATSVPQTPYDWLRKPFGVAFDAQGRILVTDSGSSALLRFDRAGRRMDVFGVRSSVRLELPLGLTVGSDGLVYVADAGVGAVIAFSPEGEIRAVYGQDGVLTNPTDAAIAPDGDQLFVTDSRSHRVVVFDLATGEHLRSFGERGGGPGQFSFPTSLAFSPAGDLFVVDQLNARIQIFEPDGNYLDEFGGRGVGFGNLVRPKDVVVDEEGLVYVVDNAFNNLQLFDPDLSLLTFVGQAGGEPGQFLGASGVAVRGEEFAVVDQLGHRLQLFRFLRPKTEEFAARPVAPKPAVGVAEAAEPEAASPEVPPPTPIPPATVDTSVAATEPPAVAPPDTQQIRGELSRFVYRWYQTWVAGTPEEHLALYSQDFRPPSGLKREAWESQRRAEIAATGGAQTGLEYHLEDFDAAVATVRLVGGPGGADQERLLVMMREGESWRIHAESFEVPASPPTER